MHFILNKNKKKANKPNKGIKIYNAKLLQTTKLNQENEKLNE